MEWSLILFLKQCSFAHNIPLMDESENSKHNMTFFYMSKASASHYVLDTLVTIMYYHLV